jgi:hypothetical protein
MAMQDYWADYFTYVEKKATREQLFDLSVAQEAKKRLDAEKPFNWRAPRFRLLGRGATGVATRGSRW